MQSKLNVELHFKDGKLLSNKPSYIQTLYNRGYICKCEGNDSMVCCLNALQTAEMASWAVATARKLWLWSR